MPVIATSANFNTELILSAYQAGTSDYVGLDYNAEVLAARLAILVWTGVFATMVEVQNSQLVHSVKALCREMRNRRSKAV